MALPGPKLSSMTLKGLLGRKDTEKLEARWRRRRNHLNAEQVVDEQYHMELLMLYTRDNGAVKIPDEDEYQPRARARAHRNAK